MVPCRLLVLLLLPLLAVVLSVPAPVSAQDNTDPNLVACLVQLSCGTCIKVNGCGWCNVNNNAGGFGGGFCSSNLQQGGVCGEGFSRFGANDVCPANSNVIGDGNPNTSPFVVDPATGQIIISGQPIGATNGNANFNNQEPSKTRVYAGVALLILTCFIAVALMIIVTIAYNRFQSVLSSHVNHQAGHQINSLPGKCAIGFVQLATWVLMLAGLAHNSWSRISGDFGGRTDFGLVSSTTFGVESKYSDFCSGATGIIKTQCNTLRAGGALTLVFGLFALLLTTAVLCLLIWNLYQGRQPEGSAAPLNHFYVVYLQTMASICVFAAVLCWSFGAHLELTAQTGAKSADLSASWGLFLTAFVLSVGLLIVHMWVYTLGDYQHAPVNSGMGMANKEFPQTQNNPHAGSLPPVVNAPYGHETV